MRGQVQWVEVEVKEKDGSEGAAFFEIAARQEWVIVAVDLDTQNSSHHSELIITSCVFRERRTCCDVYSELRDYIGYFALWENEQVEVDPVASLVEEGLKGLDL